MTTKDQAIAEIEKAIVEHCQGHDLWMCANLALQRVEKVLSATPDCRTCVKAWPNLNGCSHNCTNGDKYQQEPKVVLWRTE